MRSEELYPMGDINPALEYQQEEKSSGWGSWIFTILLGICIGLGIGKYSPGVSEYSVKTEPVRLVSLDIVHREIKGLLDDRQKDPMEYQVSLFLGKERVMYQVPKERATTLASNVPYEADYVRTKTGKIILLDLREVKRK
jgi:hypothetical protein